MKSISVSVRSNHTLTLAFFGIVVGITDMTIFKPTGFRIGELFALLIVFLEAINKNPKIRVNTIFFTSLYSVIILIIDSANTEWFIKLLIFSIFCSILLNNYLKLSSSFLLGLAVGYTLYSAGLITLGENYISKYSAVHCTLFLLYAMTSRRPTQKAFAFCALALAIYVAVESNSRGQILLFLGAIALTLLIKLKIFSIFKASIFALTIFLGPQLLSLPIKVLYLQNVMQNTDITQVNAGDLERSLLGTYALTSLLDNPRGQDRETIVSDAASKTGVERALELQTTSAHNIIEDSMLFGGFAGLTLLFIKYAYLKKNSATFFRTALSKDPNFRITSIGLLIASFILSTSPMAALERIEVLLVLSLISARTSSNTSIQSQRLLPPKKRHDENCSYD